MKQLIIIALLVLGRALPAGAADILYWHTLSGGYGVQEQDTVRLRSVAGQCAVGTMRDAGGGNTELSIGFFGSPYIMTWLARTAPDAPTGLTVTGVSDQRVDLVWDSSPETDIDHYVVYRTTDGSVTPQPSDSVGSVTSGTTYTDITGLTDGTRYYYRIAAVNGAEQKSEFSASAAGTPGLGPVTSAVHVSPDPTRTALIVTLHALAADTATGGSDIAGAEYFVDAAGNPGTGQALNVAGDGSFDSPVEVVTNAGVSVVGWTVGYHTIYVRSKDANGNWGALDSTDFIVSLTPPVITSMSPVTGFNIEPLNAVIKGTYLQDGGRVVLIRDGYADVEGMSPVLEDSVTLSCQFELSGVQAGVWDLVVINPDYERDTLLNAMTVNPAPVLTGISPRQGTIIDTFRAVSLSGSNFKDCQAFLVKSGQTDIGADSILIESDVAVMAWFDLSGAVTGTWSVVLANFDGQADTLADTFSIVLPAPVIIAVAPAAGPDTGTVNITGITGNYFYSGAAVSLERSGQTISATGVTVAAVDSITCRFDIEDAAPGSWDVIVANSGGRADTLTEGFTVTNLKPPAQPANLYALAGNNQVALSWSENTESDMAAYVVYRDTLPVSAGADSIGVVGHPTVTFTDLTVTNDITYYYWIAARDSMGNTSAWSDSISAMPSLPSIYTDSIALVALYDSAGGASWSTATNWLTGAVDTWYGVTVDNGRVTGLALPDNNLSGKLLPSLANIEYIRSLDLSGNGLTGSVPVNIGQLDSLRSLLLSGNGFTGSIPTGITGIRALEDLRLHGNNLTGAIPAAIGSLTSLRTFTADSNALTGSLPAGFGSLLNLEYLSVSHNVLTGTVPAGLAGAVSLKSLDLSGNGFSGTVPSVFDGMTGLYHLSLADNDLTGIPDLSGLSLTHLSLDGNALTFENIEPYIGIDTFSYVPQDSVGTARDTVVQSGTALTLTVSVGGSANRYQWSRNGDTLAAPSASADLAFGAVALSDSGRYACAVTNTAATALTIHSRPVRVRVDAAPAAPVGLSVTAGDEKATLAWGANGETDFLMYRIYMGFAGGALALKDSTAKYSKNTTSKIISGITADSTYIFRITAMDTNRFESQYSGQATAYIGNYAPSFSSTAAALNDTIDEDAAYSTVVVATDPNAGDTVTYGLISPSPSGMTVDAAAGTLRWVPDNGQVGDNTVTVTAEDPAGLKDTLQYVLHVLNVNDAPVIISAVADTAVEDMAFIYVGAASDPDDTPVLAYVGVPSWLQATGDTLKGTPREGAGDTVVTLIASDGQLADTLTVSLTVVPVNDPPVITSPSVALAIASEMFEYIITVADPDDVPSVSVPYYPSWMSLAGTDTLRGTPVADAPDTSFMIVASDGQLSDTLVVMLTVQDSNTAPVIVSDSMATATEDSLFRYVAAAADAEGNPLQITFPVRPSWLTADNDTLSGTPLEGMSDTVFLVVATDGKLYDTLLVNLDVLAVNDPPVIVSAATDTATEDVLFRYVARATDPESQPLIGFTGVPSWLSQSGDTLSGIPGEGTGDTSFVIQAYDGQFYDSLEVDLTVLAVNDPPVITSAAADTAFTGTPFQYLGSATDPDDVPVISYLNLPSWLTADGDTLRGTATAGTPDTVVTLIASDGELADTQIVVIDVQTVSFDTLRITSPARDTAIEGSLFVYTAAATSPNMPVTITFYAASWPSWLDTVGATVQGTPPTGASDASFFVIARDAASATKMLTVDIVVMPPNIAPYITSGSTVEAREGVTFTYVAAAADSNPDDVVALSFEDFPAWLDTAGATISGVPPAGSQLTFLAFTVIASDGRLYDTLAISTLIFPPLNLAPYITSATADTAREGLIYAYAATATDPNAADTLTYSFIGLPGWLVFDGDSTVSGNPPQGFGGSDTLFRVAVTDQGDSTDTVTVSLHILTPLNVAPVLTSAARDTAFEGRSYHYTATALDSNYDDTVAFLFLNIPEWLDTAGTVLSGVITGLNADTVFAFTVVATDLDGAADTLVCSLTVVDNQAPSVTLDSAASVPDTAGGDITVGYTVADAEGDTVHLICQYFDDSTDTWKPATVTGDTAGLDTASYSGSLVWHCATDLAGRVLDHVSAFRIIPADAANLYGQADSTGTFVLFNLLGDFDADGALGFADLDSFAVGWHTQRAGMDIGPAAGSFPSLVPEPDGRVDAEDLNILLLLFNWAVAGGYTDFSLPASKTGGLSASILFKTGPDGNTAIRLEGIPAPLSISIRLDYDPARIILDGVTRSPWQGTGTPLQVLFDKNEDGYIAAYTASLTGEFLPDPDGAYDLFSFRVQKGNAEPVSVSYEARDAEGRLVAAGSQECLLDGTRLQTLQPAGVFPNPSTDGPLDMYCASRSAGRITYSVFNMNGVQVHCWTGEKDADLVSRHRWNGCDDRTGEQVSGTCVWEIGLNGLRWTGRLNRR